MHFGDDEKPGRKAALENLIKIMGDHKSEKLKGLKKPAAVAVEVEGVEEAPEDEEMVDGDEPSEEDKAKIAELYHKYCK